MSILGFQDLKRMSTWWAGLAEFIGVMFLIIIACGSCYPYDNVRIGLVFGFTIAALVWATSHVSGGHLNPAVSLAFLVTRKMSVCKFLVYFMCQIGGALVGAGILMGVAAWPYKGVKNTLCTSMPMAPLIGMTSSPMSPAQVFGVELLITFMLVWTVFATVDPGRSTMAGSKPLAIGLAIAIGNFWAAPLTGAGMNPARVFGPAVVSSTWTDHWAYWIGPFIGAIAAAFLYDFIFSVNASPSKFKGFFTMDYNNDNYDRLGQKEEPDENSELRNSGTHSSKEASYGAMDGRLSSGAEA